MDSDATRGHAGPSVFSRPPQPRAASTTGSPAARAAAGERSSPVAQAGVGGATPAGEERTALEAQRRSGGQWFYWIAALSLVNIVVALTGQEWRFILGLGITEVVQQMAQQSGGAEMKAALVGLAVIGFFAVLGQRAIQGRRWAFVVGMAIYGVDGAIFLLVQDWVGVGFHAFAITMIARGYLAARQLSPAKA